MLVFAVSCNRQDPVPPKTQTSTSQVDSLLILRSGKNDSINRRALLQFAVSVYGQGDYPKFKTVCDLALQRSTSAKDTAKIIKARSYLGKYYGNLNINDSAYLNYSKAEKLALRIKDDKSLGNIYVSEAFIQLYINDYSSCEIAASKAVNYISNTDPKKMYDAYNLIGICSNEMQRYDQALEYHNKALKLVSDNNLNDYFHRSSNSLNNIGVVYQNTDNHLKAITYFQRALQDGSLFADAPGLYAILLDNLAYSRFKTKTNNAKDVPSLFYKSLKIRDSLKLNSGIVINKIHLSEYFAAKKDSVKARKWAHEALDLSRSTGISGDILLALNQISSIENKSAIAYSKEYIKISDSIQKVERSVRDKFARIQMETREISQEKSKLEVQNRNLLYFFVVLLMIGLLLFVIRTQRAKNRELMLIQAQQKANEDIYNLMINQQTIIEESRVREKKRIAQELHDGILGRLFGARLNLDSLNRDNSLDVVSKRNQYLSELKNIEQDIREISHDLNREKYLLVNNFTAILTNLLETQQSSFSPNLNYQIDSSINWEVLDNTAKINLYRIIQECLQNINKYANAKNISVILKKVGTVLSLTISDDGGGFDTKTKKKGIGLQNISSRADELKGVLEIKSEIGVGTIVQLTTSLI